MFLYPSVQIPMEVYLYSTLFSFFLKFRNLDIFSLMNWNFGLILFSTVSIIEFIIFSRVILISMFVCFFMINNNNICVLKG